MKVHKFLPSVFTVTLLYCSTVLCSTPLSLKIEPQQSTVFYGETVSINASIYDQNAVDLTEFKNNTNFDSCFSWDCISPLSNSNPVLFIDSIGATIVLLPQISFQHIQIVCTFHFGSTVLCDTSEIVVHPVCCNYRLYIEADYHREVSPNVVNPIDTIRFRARTDTIHLYAIKRDQYGNYVSPARNAKWYANSNIIGIKKGIDSLGEVLIYPDSVVGFGDGLLFCKDTLNNVLDTTVVDLFFVSHIKSSMSRIVRNESITERVYNIYGRRVLEPKSHGVYIVKAQSNGASSRVYIRN